MGNKTNEVVSLETRSMSYGSREERQKSRWSSKFMITPTNMPSVLLCDKESSSILDWLHLATFRESREWCATLDQRRY